MADGTGCVFNDEIPMAQIAEKPGRIPDWKSSDY